MHDDISAGHLGLAMTYDKIKQRYIWQEMYKERMHWIQTCKDCMSKKSPKRPAAVLMQSIPVEGPSDCVCVDVLGPLPQSEQGNLYIVVLLDSLTKWLEAFAIRTTGSVIVNHMLRKLCLNMVYTSHIFV